MSRQKHILVKVRQAGLLHDQLAVHHQLAPCEFVTTAAPDEEQSRDLDLLLAVGQLFVIAAPRADGCRCLLNSSAEAPGRGPGRRHAQGDKSSARSRVA
ncbi:hypothetical protein ACF08O_07575 [Streptomyces paradoxus]|uniref:hypothetical protein n=1 Tax=Streptomyces paradoxus TaxID=66375 RepID=UPI0036F72C56